MRLSVEAMILVIFGDYNCNCDCNKEEISHGDSQIK
jgi:hypothetical protein